MLNTLIKQRKESVEQFLKGGRKEMADKEAAEITLIETYLPKAAGEAEIVCRREGGDRRNGIAHYERYGRSEKRPWLDSRLPECGWMGKW